MARYRSQILQSLHYFARPHEKIRRMPLRVRAAWRSDEFAAQDWRETLTPADVAEFDDALDHVAGLARTTAELTREDFALPRMTAKFERWRDEIENGRGFVVLRGIPVDRWSQERTERFFWCFGLHLGVPGAQNPSGDLLGHVRDEGAPGDGSSRQYRTREFIDYHCDLADVVGLLCVRAAKRGGASRIASSVTAYNEALTRRPDLIDRLYEPFRLDTKGEGGVPYIPIEPCRFAGGQLRTFWHAGYFRSVTRYPGVREHTQEELEILDLYEEILNEPGCALEMDLEPGDIQLLSNHTIVHGRTAFEDDPSGVEGRHLLRLWLSLPHAWHLAERLGREWNRARVLGRLARMRMHRR